MSNLYFDGIGSAGRIAWNWVASGIEEVGEEIADVASTVGETIVANAGPALMANVIRRAPGLGLLIVGGCPSKSPEERRVDEYVQQLQSIRVETRLDAARGLRTLIESDVTPSLRVSTIAPLLAALNDSHDLVRIETAQALLSLVTSNIPIDEKIRIIEPVFNVLNDSHRDVRANAVDILGTLYRDDAVQVDQKNSIAEVLISVANEDQDSTVQTVLVPLMQLFAESDISTVLKQEMIIPLTKFALQYRYQDGGGIALETLVNLFAQLDVPQNLEREMINLCLATATNQQQSGHHVLSVFARSGVPSELKARMVETLFVNLRDPRSQVRAFAARALESFGHLLFPAGQQTRIISMLILASSDDNDRVRSSALRAIGSFANYETAPGEKDRMLNALSSALQDISWDVRLAAFGAISRFNEAGLNTSQRSMLVDPLISLLRNIRGARPGESINMDIELGEEVEAILAILESLLATDISPTLKQMIRRAL